MKSRLLYGFLVVSLGIMTSGCAAKLVKTIERGDTNWGRSVLIATEQSPFKEAVISKVMDELEKDACFVRVIDLSRLADESSENYDAVVILNSLVFWDLNGDARDFLDSIGEQEQERIILLTTAGHEPDEEYWRPEGLNVDSITCASVIDKSGLISERIIENCRALF